MSISVRCSCFAFSIGQHQRPEPADACLQQLAKAGIALEAIQQPSQLVPAADVEVARSYTLHGPK